MYQYYFTDELYHHGIKGQRWGVRRFQNEDGSLTAKGEKRYAKGEEMVKKGQTVGSKNKAIKKTLRNTVLLSIGARVAAGVLANKLMKMDMQGVMDDPDRLMAVAPKVAAASAAVAGLGIAANAHHAYAIASTIKRSRDKNSIRLYNSQKKKERKQQNG